MGKVNTVRVVSALTCDMCYTTSNDPKGWYELEELSEVGLLLLEQPKRIVTNPFLDIYTGRKEICFCSRDCLTKYVSQKMDLFVAGLDAAKDRKGKNFESLQA